MARPNHFASAGLTLPLALAAACASSEPRHHLLPGADTSLPFSHVVEAGDTVHVAGTLGLDPDTGQPPTDPSEEARLLLDEIRAKLALVGLACGIPFAVVILQGDFGSAMVWLPVSAALLLVGNIPFRYMVTVGLLGFMVIPWAYYFGLKPHQKERITVYADMLRGKAVDTQGSAYAASYIEKAVGSGGFNGKGRLNEKTINNLGFIPKRTAINDFIFAVWAEEMGFRGSVVILGGFTIILLQGLFIAFHARDAVGRLICVGVVALIFAHVFQHVGMNLLIMPITGIPLPFLSAGGTFVVVCMFLCGIMQSVWVHRGTAASRIALAGETPLFGASAPA